MLLFVTRKSEKELEPVNLMSRCICMITCKCYGNKVLRGELGGVMSGAGMDET